MKVGVLVLGLAAASLAGAASLALLSSREALEIPVPELSSPPRPCFPFPVREDEATLDCPLLGRLFGLNRVDGLLPFTGSTAGRLDSYVEESFGWRTDQSQRIRELINAADPSRFDDELGGLLQLKQMTDATDTARRHLGENRLAVSRACNDVVQRAYGVLKRLDAYRQVLARAEIAAREEEPAIRRELLNLADRANLLRPVELRAQMELLAKLPCEGGVDAHVMAALGRHVHEMSFSDLNQTLATQPVARSWQALIDAATWEVSSEVSKLLATISRLESWLRSRRRSYRELAAIVLEQRLGRPDQRAIAAGLIEAIPLIELVVGRANAIVLANSSVDHCDAKADGPHRERDDCRARFQRTTRRWRDRLDALEMIVDEPGR